MKAQTKCDPPNAIYIPWESRTPQERKEINDAVVDPNRRQKKPRGPSERKLRTCTIAHACVSGRFGSALGSSTLPVLVRQCTMSVSVR